VRAGAAAPRRAAILAGLAVSFVTAVHLLRALRPELLLDREPAWALPRLFLGLAAVAVAAAAGIGAASVVFLWSRQASFGRSMPPLPFGPPAAALLAAGAILAGTLLRLASISEIPWSLWVDDLSLIAPALALEGGVRDFADSIRAAPYGVPRPYGSVGVLYLEAYRASLLLWGTTVFGVRFLSFLAGAVSLVTAALLGRALLPRGGGALTALILAGLRWSLILSRWGWNAIVLIPVLDVAALLLLRARRRGSLRAAAGAGFVAGIGAHIYLSAWVAFAGLFALALWPIEEGEGFRRRVRLGSLCLVGFLAAAAPLFLLRKDRAVSYFARTSSHNVFKEIGYRKSVMAPFAAAADALTSPWFPPDPTARHDIPGRSRLGWIFGLPVAAVAIRSLVFPRDRLSAFLLAHAAAALAGAVAGGEAQNPNSYRFAYLTTVTAVGAAGGALWLLRWVPAARRHLAAIGALGLLSIGGVLGARDALFRWGESRETFDAFFGQDTLIPRAALRWERFGEVGIDASVGFETRTQSRLTMEPIRRYRLDPEEPRREEILGRARPGDNRRRAFRIAPPRTEPGSAERLVERIRDGWGRDWAVVLGRRISPAAGSPIP